MAALKRILGPRSVRTQGWDLSLAIDLSWLKGRRRSIEYDDALAIFKRLHGVDSLYASNAATDDMLESIKHWRQLTWLNASSFLVTDGALRHLRGLKRLSHLELGGPQITEAGVAQIAALSSLRELVLSGTTLSDAGAAQLAALKDLEELNLVGSRVSGEGLEPLSRLEHLKSLDLSSSRVTDKGLATIAHIGSLERVNLRNTDVTDAGVAALASLENLRRLYVGGSFATEGVRSHFRNADDLKIYGLMTAADLKRLDDPANVAAIRAAGVDVNTNNDLRNVTKIDAQGNTRPSEWLSRITRLHELTVLVLPRCVSDEEVIAACKVRTLTTLRVQQAGITSYALQEVGNLSELRELDLSGCTKVGDSVIPRLLPLMKLQDLDLAYTRVTDAGLTRTGRNPQHQAS